MAGIPSGNIINTPVVINVKAGGGVVPYPWIVDAGALRFESRNVAGSDDTEVRCVIATPAIRSGLDVAWCGVQTGTGLQIDLANPVTFTPAESFEGIYSVTWAPVMIHATAGFGGGTSPAIAVDNAALFDLGDTIRITEGPDSCVMRVFEINLPHEVVFTTNVPDTFTIAATFEVGTLAELISANTDLNLVTGVVTLDAADNAPLMTSDVVCQYYPDLQTNAGYAIFQIDPAAMPFNVMAGVAIIAAGGVQIGFIPAGNLLHAFADLDLAATFGGASYCLALVASDPDTATFGPGIKLTGMIGLSQQVANVMAITDTTCVIRMEDPDHAPGVVVLGQIVAKVDAAPPSAYVEKGIGIAMVANATVIGLVEGTTYQIKSTGYAPNTEPGITVQEQRDVMSGQSLVSSNIWETPGAVMWDPIQVFGVGAGGDYCDGEAGTGFSLTGSEIGCNYQAFESGLPVGAPIPGTGAALAFGPFLAGTYTVESSRFGITRTMTGSAIIVEVPAPVANAGSDRVITAGDPVTINDASASNYASLLWYTPDGSGVFANETTLTPTYTPSMADRAMGAVTLVLTAVGNPPCIGDEDQMTLTINP